MAWCKRATITKTKQRKSTKKNRQTKNKITKDKTHQASTKGRIHRQGNSNKTNIHEQHAWKRDNTTLNIQTMLSTKTFETQKKWQYWKCMKIKNMVTLMSRKNKKKNKRFLIRSKRLKYEQQVFKDLWILSS